MSRRPVTLAVVLAVAVLTCRLSAVAQDDFYHPELNWRTIETEHFYVLFHDGEERTARVIAKVAEDIYEPVTSLYRHEPDGKVTFVVRDYDDISNGAAYFFDNKIEIFAPSMDFELRGTHDWLRNVVTHEFTHVVQIQTSMKFGRRVPAIYLQWLGYEAERRPDVLYGYPNVIASYPLSGFVVPAWFAEGVAQYNRTDLRYDFWDTHRDMILRSYALDGNMLTWEQMGVFGKTSLGNESAYNAGFAFVGYIARTYGEDKLREISRNLASLPVVTIDAAIERAIGKPGAEVYDDWRRDMVRDYTARVAPIKTNLHEGTPFLKEDASVVSPGERIKSETMFHPQGLPQGAHQEPCCIYASGTGFANMYPSYSPDGRKLAYVSTKGGDYFSLSSLYVYDFVTGQDSLIMPGVRTAPAWSPDGRTLYYGKATRDNPHWSYQFDIYKYDLVKQEETRITRGKRACSPTVSPDGSQLACVVNADGTTNLAVMSADGSNYHVVTPYHEGEQVYRPQWSPRGDRILFDYSMKDGRDIAWVKPDGSDLALLLSGPEDTRCATFSHDGSKVYFSSDVTGIFNIYSYDLASHASTQWTNVLGGAFFPTVDSTGDIVYASYTSSGYKIVRLNAPRPIEHADSSRYLPPTSPDASPAPTTGILAFGPTHQPDTKQFDWPSLRSYDDTKLAPLDSRPYKSMFTSLTIVPFLRFDNYNISSNGLDVIKPGLYLFSNDMLDKTGFFAGAAVNRKLEADLFLQFFYRGRLPLLYDLGLEPVGSLELYNVSRKTDTFVSLPDRPAFPVGVTYNLFEFDAALSQPFLSQFGTVELRYAHSRYSSALGSFTNELTGDLIPASSDLYLIANTLTLTYDLNAIVPSSTSDINPIGRKVQIRLSGEWNKFGATDSAGYRVYQLTPTGLEPLYDKIDFFRAELNWHEFLPSPVTGHTIGIWLRGGSIFGPPVDEFFDFYAGGLVGMKGYTFYALSGNSLASVGLTYRFPLISDIDLRIGQIYFDKLYASVYGEFGNAWTETGQRLRDFKKDAGAEIRLQAFSFYSYPTSIFFDASYGFDRFSRFIKTQNETVTYGKEWRFYFGVLFGFDFD
ncbi:MAG TPA: biopolymer transporter Tol [Bacteroidota bacterium]|nr:biopolymer transporter Tol [Bacteroidota bacterium]